MIIAIGSTNPPKVQAVKLAVSDKFKHVRVVSVDVDTGVSLQPMTDDETQRGAENRARAALKAVKNADLGIGLEGGAQPVKQGLMNSVWACVVDREGRAFFTNGERFLIPKHIAERMIAGEEMGPVLNDLTNDPDIKNGRGFIGIMTNDYMLRAEAYSHVAKLAIGLWYGADQDAHDEK